MKIKLLVAALACVALGACSKADENKPKPGAEHKTEAEPKVKHESSEAKPAEGHSFNEGENLTTLAAEDQQAAMPQTATTTPAAASSTESSMQDMKQDMTKTTTEIQGEASVPASTEHAVEQDHPHAED